MNLYLAITCSFEKQLKDIKNKFVLESFFSVKPWQMEALKIGTFENFMLDSGAYSFIKKHNKTIDWDSYVARYIDYINANRIDLFFELDIDFIIGIDRVEYFRKKIENKTGKQSIPVWHRERGKDYFLGLCKDYSYIALGGFAIKHIKKTEYCYIKGFLDLAKKNNCKIHGLGFTDLSWLKILPFYSVDSSTWAAHQYGVVFTYKDGSLKRTTSKKYRALTYPVLVHNYYEWLKFQRYAEVCL